MRHSRAIGALISTVVALGALGAPAAANGDGITFVYEAPPPEGGCVMDIRKDGETFKTLSDGIGEAGFMCHYGEGYLSAGVDRAENIGDGLVYFLWGRYVMVSGGGGAGGGGPTSGYYEVYYGKAWVTDGTEAGTVERDDICPDVWLVGKTVLYTRCGYVWSWVRDADTTVLAQQPGYPTAVLGDRLIYPFKDSRGEELWAVTAGGTAKLLKDIRPGPKGSGSKDFRVRWGRLYFTANDGNGVARWVTDGTREGTRRVNW